MEIIVWYSGVDILCKTPSSASKDTGSPGADLGEDAGGAHTPPPPFPEMTCGFLTQLVFCKKSQFLHSLVMHPLLRKIPGPAPVAYMGSSPSATPYLERRTTFQLPCTQWMFESLFLKKNKIPYSYSLWRFMTAILRPFWTQRNQILIIILFIVFYYYSITPFYNIMSEECASLSRWYIEEQGKFSDGKRSMQTKMVELNDPNFEVFTSYIREMINLSFDGLTYNTSGHFAHCSYFSTQCTKYPRVLYVKPLNKVYVLHSFTYLIETMKYILVTSAKVALSKRTKPR